MKKATFVAAAVSALTVAVSSAAQAQVFTPTYLSPVRGGELGIYVSDGPGDLGLEGIYRMRQSAFDLGLRLGFADADDATALMLGLDYRNPLELAGAAPLALAVTGTAQGVLGDAEGFGAMVGLSLGGTVRSPGLAVTPYVHPRVGIVDELGPGEADLDVRADLGVDLDFGGNLSLRFGANLGDGADWGIGLAWRR